ncbi:MAG: hypothetical protein PHV68_01565 [Candidatus Gastranaerophilales bacterium]|nr:hypothetical protein [Candidatus Gastranaerophilales bacterium]
MKKNIIILISLLMIITGFILFQQSNNKNVEINSKIIIYYFFKEPWGEKCEKIKNYTNEVINKTFSTEQKNNHLEFKLINYNKDKGKQKKYKITEKSMILVKFKENKELEYKVLNKARNIIDDENEFKKYLNSEIKKFNMMTNENKKVKNYE